MSQKGGLLVGIIIVTLLILPLLVVLNFGYLGSIGKVFGPSNSNGNNSQAGVSGLLGQAQQVKVQANLKAVSTALEVYYADLGSYPTSLAELGDYLSGTDTSDILYVRCSSSSAIVYHNSENYPGYILGGNSPKPTNGSMPSC